MPHLPPWLSKGVTMLRTRSFIKLGLLGILASLMPAAASAASWPSTQESATCIELSHDLIFRGESETDTSIRKHTATVKTELLITKINPPLLVLWRSRHDFHAQLDLSRSAGTTKPGHGEEVGNLIWQIDLLSFADWIFVDSQGFTPARYTLNFIGPEWCEDRTCCAYDVIPDPKAVHAGPTPFFIGKIWVEPANSTIISFKGIYVPASHLKPTLAVENYFQFETHRREIAPHIWLPSSVLAYNTGNDSDASFPQFKSETMFSKYQSR
jgi:hypothetical protein